MAKQPRDNEAFTKALIEHYKAPDADSFVKLPAFQKAFSDTGGDPMEAAEILNRVKEKGVDAPAWVLRATQVQEFDEKANNGKGSYIDKGPGIEVLLPTMRTRTYPFSGDTSNLRPLTPAKVKGVTRLFKVYEKEEDWVDLEKGNVAIESHTADMPPADPEWVFRDGSDGKDPGPIYKLDKKRGTIQGDTGDRPVFGIYTVKTSADDIKVGDGRFSKGRAYVQVTVETPSGRKLRAKFYNVAQLAARHGLDERARGQEWADALDGKQFAALGKIGILHPREAKFFDHPEGKVPEGHLSVFAARVMELERGGYIAKSDIKNGKNAGQQFMQLDLSKAPTVTNAKGEEVQPTFVRICYDEVCTHDKHKVYKLEKKPGEEWKAMVMASDVGGLPWLSFTPGEVRTREDGETDQWGADYFCTFLDALPGQKKVVDTNNPFAQALQRQGLAKFA